jgi:hypothetical protein
MGIRFFLSTGQTGANQMDFNSTEAIGELERSEREWASISPEQKADLARCKYHGDQTCPAERELADIDRQINIQIVAGVVRDSGSDS